MKVTSVYETDDGKVFKNEMHALAREKYNTARFELYCAHEEAERLQEKYDEMVEECKHPIVEVRKYAETFVTCLICDEAFVVDESQLKTKFKTSEKVIIK